MLRSIQARSLFVILPRPNKADDTAGTSGRCSLKTAFKTPGQMADVSSASGVSAGLFLSAWAGCGGRPGEISALSTVHGDNAGAWPPSGSFHRRRLIGRFHSRPWPARSRPSGEERSYAFKLKQALIASGGSSPTAVLVRVNHPSPCDCGWIACV